MGEGHLWRREVQAQVHLFIGYHTEFYRSGAVINIRNYLDILQRRQAIRLVASIRPRVQWPLMRNVLDINFRVTALCRRLKSNAIKSSGRTCRVLGRALLRSTDREGWVQHLSCLISPRGRYSPRTLFPTTKAIHLLHQVRRAAKYNLHHGSVIVVHILKAYQLCCIRHKFGMNSLAENAWSTNMRRALIEFQHNREGRYWLLLTKADFCRG